MKTSVEFIIYLATAAVSLQNVMGNRGLPSVSCVNPAVIHVAHPGDLVNISCKYLPAEGGAIRHFCRVDETSQCTTLISAKSFSHTRKERFSLTDDKQRDVFNVTISAVTETDGGRYKCVLENVENSTTKCLTEIQLIVSDEHRSVNYTKDTPNTHAVERDIKTNTPPPDDTPLNKGIVVSVVGCLVLLMTGTLVLLLVGHRLSTTKVCCAVGGSNTGSQTEENHRHDYEEIQGTPGAVLHSVYASVGHPTNQLHHQRLSSNGSEPSSAPDRSSVNGAAAHPPAAEQTVYSTLAPPAEP